MGVMFSRKHSVFNMVELSFAIYLWQGTSVTIKKYALSYKRLRIPVVHELVHYIHSYSYRWDETKTHNTWVLETFFVLSFPLNKTIII